MNYKQKLKDHFEKVENKQLSKVVLLYKPSGKGILRDQE